MELEGLRKIEANEPVKPAGGTALFVPYTPSERDAIRVESWRAYNAGECAPMTSAEIEFEMYGPPHFTEDNIQPLE